jgi:hypothetical protein
MEMARTCINVIGNCLATVVLARWEGVFRMREWVVEEAELETGHRTARDCELMRGTTYCRGAPDLLNAAAGDTRRA